MTDSVETELTQDDSEKVLQPIARIAVAVTIFVAACALLFNVVVFMTDLAISPTDDPCFGLTGRLSCISHVEVMAATLLPAVLIAGFVWYLMLRRGWTVLAIGIAVLIVVVAIAVWAWKRPNCGEEPRLGIVTNTSLDGNDGSPYWDCLGGIR